MTTNNAPLDLPEIPSLPPIEMPNSSFLDGPRYGTNHELLSPLNPSSLSLVSQDTFMTADSSPSSDQSTSPATNSPGVLPPSLPAPPPATLRKSLSEEYLFHPKQYPDAAARSSRGLTLSSMSRPVPDASLHHGHAAVSPLPTAGVSSGRPVSQWKDHETHATPRRAGPSRSRGTSISNSTTEDDSSLPDDSDWDREDMINMARKTKGSRKIPRPEELPLPSRLQTVSSSPTMGKPPPPIVPDRNSSLHKLTKQRSLISVNTHIPPVRAKPQGVGFSLTSCSSPVSSSTYGCYNSCSRRRWFWQVVGHPEGLEVVRIGRRQHFLYSSWRGGRSLSM